MSRPVLVEAEFISDKVGAPFNTNQFYILRIEQQRFGRLQVTPMRTDQPEATMLEFRHWFPDLFELLSHWRIVNKVRPTGLFVPESNL